MIEVIAFLVYLLVWSVPTNVPDIQENVEKSRSVYMDVSAYTPHESGSLTASGDIPIEGVTVAYNGVPFGTVLEIDGHRYIVQDRCGMDRVDIFMESHEDAMKWGVRRKEIKIYEGAAMDK